MNIVYVSNSSAPSVLPSSLQIAKTCESLSFFSDNKVTLIIPNTKKIDADFCKFYNIKSKFNIIVLKFFTKFPIGPYYYIFAFISVLLSIKIKANLIITRNFFVIFLCNLFRLNCILELHHDIDVEGRVVQFLVKNTNLLNSKKIIKIIAISEAIKKHYIYNYQVTTEKIIVLPSGSSIKQKFQFRFKKILNIGYFGSLTFSKGINLILELSKLDRKNHYWIYGGYKDNVRNLILKNNGTNLHINTYLPYKKLVNAMSDMDILLLPYKNIVHSAGDVGNIAEFTSPLKLFDYLACGKLIMASDLNVFKEVISNNKNCILVDNFNSPFSWLNQIKKIENNHIKRFIFSKNGYFLSKKFSHNNRVKFYTNNILL